MKYLIIRHPMFFPLVSRVGLLIISLTGVVFLQNIQVNQNQSFLGDEDYQSQEKEQQLELKILAKIPALGFSNLLADWNYLKFIQYFGDSTAREKIGYALAPDYFTQIVKRDPRFVDALLKLDTATSVFGGYPRKSVALLHQALSLIPLSLKNPGYPPYYLWQAKGINELLFLGDFQGAKQSYQMAAKVAKDYPSQASQNFIARTEQTIKFLEHNPNSKIAQIGAWATILGTNPDPRTLKRVIQEINALGGTIVRNSDGSLSVKVPDNLD
jgi:tetratricopeptide (TPR) repeat protein